TSLLAMRALTIPELSMGRCLISSLVMGVGISAMHYLCMSAMRSAATQYYEPRLFALSILVAVLSSIALLTLSRHLR
ncbi:MHYT domain-containing protein, partial [Pseudomonas syringae pv. tagetis]|uniref:MHYT domain-containing protein n=1 Tax=Pseudomonas syringae group genomosp. 7 TaxID=251699 RepID=UPI00376FA626